jgi:two-component system repressor protein LuxO
MTEQLAKVLLVEDERSLAALYGQYLKNEPIEITHAATGREAVNHIEKHAPDAVLLDIRLPDMMGTEILEEINNRGMDTAVIMITAHGSINTAVETMRGGAYDFLVKPFNRERLLQTLNSALNRKKLASLVREQELSLHDGFQGFIGSSEVMQVVYRTIEAASDSKATVFVTGESGTGKEVAAEAIHSLSGRVNKPLVVLNCAAIPKDLMESEIFGHVKGAFTGAVNDHDGAASQADGGTLFLDEICEMDIHLQSKLLRFIQTGTFHKVGSAKTECVDIRFVCATNRDPLIEIGAGRFREDLYYRLHVIPVQLPPLRDRPEDIMPVAMKFLHDYSEEEKREFELFSDQSINRLVTYDWPGNVRQLQNVIRQVVVMNKGRVVEEQMLPFPLYGSSGQSISTPPARAIYPTVSGMGTPPSHALPAPPMSAYGTGNMPHNNISPLQPEMPLQHSLRPKQIQPLWQTEKDAIQVAIDSCNGNIPKAAALLGISASTIYRKKQVWEAEEAKGLE